MKFDFSETDASKFGVISMAAGIPTLVLFITVVVLLSVIFHWRPETYAIKRIANTTGKEPKSFLVIFLAVLWWITFSLPPIGGIVYGLLVALLIKPVQLGISIAIVIPALMFLLFVAMNYKNRGYVANFFIEIMAGIIALCLVAVFLVNAFLIDPFSWSAIGYAISFPALLLFSIGLFFRRKRVLPEDKLEETTFNENAEHIINEIVVGKGNLGLIWSVLTALVSALFNIIFYLIFKDKDEKEATQFTGIASFIVDLFLVLLCSAQSAKASTYIITVLIYIIKVVSISFTEKYWLAGQACVYFVLGTYFFYKMLHGIYKKATESKKVNAVPETETNSITEKLLTLAPAHNGISALDLLTRICIWVVVTALVCVELYFKWDAKLELYHDVEQRYIMISLISLSVDVGLAIFALTVQHANQGKITVLSGILYVISFAGFICITILVDGIDDINAIKYTGFLIYFFIVVTAIACVAAFHQDLSYFFYHIKKYFTCKCDHRDFIIFTSIILLIIDVALLVIFPFCFDDLSFIGLAIVGVFLIIIMFFIFCINFVNIEVSAKSNVVFLIFPIFLIVGCCVALAFVKDWIFALAIGLILLDLISIIIGMLWVISNPAGMQWKQALLIVIPSFVVLALSVVLMIMSDKYTTLAAIVSLILVFIVFGSLAYKALQNNNKIGCVPITMIALLIIFAIADIVLLALELKDALLIITLCVGIITVVCILGMIGIGASSGRNETVAFAETIVPVFYYSNKTISTSKWFMTITSIAFIFPYLWGIFASIYMTQQNIGIIVISLAIFIIPLVLLYLVCNFDSRSIVALKSMPIDLINDSISKAKDASTKPEKLNDIDSISDYKSYVEAVERNVQSDISPLHFRIALKSELFITSNNEIEKAVLGLHNFCDDDFNEPQFDFLLLNKHWSPEEMIELFNLYHEALQSDPQIGENTSHEDFIIAVDELLKTRMKSKENEKEILKEEMHMQQEKEKNEKNLTRLEVVNQTLAANAELDKKAEEEEEEEEEEKKEEEKKDEPKAEEKPEEPAAKEELNEEDKAKIAAENEEKEKAEKEKAEKENEERKQKREQEKLDKKKRKEAAKAERAKQTKKLEAEKQKLEAAIAKYNEESKAWEEKKKKIQEENARKVEEARQRRNERRKAQQEAILNNAKKAEEERVAAEKAAAEKEKAEEKDKNNSDKNSEEKEPANQQQEEEEEAKEKEKEADKEPENRPETQKKNEKKPNTPKKEEKAGDDEYEYEYEEEEEEEKKEPAK